MARRKAPTLPAACEVADRRDVTTTAVCESGRHRICPGRIISATPAHGQACQCNCHADHAGKVA